MQSKYFEQKRKHYNKVAVTVMIHLYFCTISHHAYSSLLSSLAIPIYMDFESSPMTNMLTHPPLYSKSLNWFSPGAIK